MTHEEAIEHAVDVTDNFKRWADFSSEQLMEKSIAAYLDARGSVLVPREPTELMIAEGDVRIIDFLNDHSFALRDSTPAEECFKAMIAASPPIIRVEGDGQ